jgi:hypothetical protein
MPMKVVTVDDEEGRLCVITAEQQERWRRHFSKVLNVLNSAELDFVDQVGP